MNLQRFNQILKEIQTNHIDNNQQSLIPNEPVSILAENDEKKQSLRKNARNLRKWRRLYGSPQTKFIFTKVFFQFKDLIFNKIPKFYIIILKFINSFLKSRSKVIKTLIIFIEITRII